MDRVSLFPLYTYPFIKVAFWYSYDDIRCRADTGIKAHFEEKTDIDWGLLPKLSARAVWRVVFLRTRFRASFTSQPNEITSHISHAAHHKTSKYRSAISDTVSITDQPFISHMSCQRYGGFATWLLFMAAGYTVRRCSFTAQHFYTHISLILRRYDTLSRYIYISEMVPSYSFCTYYYRYYYFI